MLTLKMFLWLVSVLPSLYIVSSEQNWTWINSQLADDPRLQQLRQIARMHQAKVDITQPKEVFYLDDEKNFQYPIFTRQTISSSIVIMSVEMLCLHYYGYCEEINFSNFYLLFLVQEEYIYYRLPNTKDKWHQFIIWFAMLASTKLFYMEFEILFHVINNITLLCIWNPLQSDIIGFGVNENLQLTIQSLNLNYYYEESRINITNQNIIAYIQPAYLEAVNNDILQPSKDDFLILMTFNLHKNQIDFHIPNHCIQSDISPLRVYFESAGNWTSFGTFSIPQNNLSYPTCFVERISNLRFDVFTKRYHKSSESAKYCPPHTYNIGSYKIDFEITQTYHRAYPTSLHFDDKLNIIYAYCAFQNLSFNHQSLDFSNISIVKTGQTLTIYKQLVNYFHTDYLDLQFELNSNTTYIDIYFYFLLLCHTSNEYSIDYLLPIFVRGIQLLQLEVSYEQHSKSLSILTYLFLFNTNRENFPRKITPTLIVEYINVTVLGIAFYNDNTAKLLLSRISNETVAIDDSIDVIVQFPNNCLDRYFTATVFLFIDEFYYKQSNLSKTKILSIYYLNHYLLCNATESDIDIYLRLPYDDGSGYWHQVDAFDYDGLTSFFISESNQNICGSNLMWNLIYTPWIDQPIELKQFPSTETKTVDIFSRLSILLNPTAGRNYYKNYENLTLIKTTTSILSIIGISSIFLSCLLFKDWLKRRIYLNQLCLSLLIQTIFFLLNTNLLNHIAYVIFYYSILTQFVWMAFVSYVQYARFIKVFGESHFSIPKSLTIGWGLPAIVTTASTILYMDCLKCQFCSKSDDIFLYFVIVPIILIITCNIVVYIAVMINLWKSDVHQSHKKYRIRATVALPFMLGLVWIVMASIMAPVPIISLVGWYLFYFIIPSQGFILFIFLILLDKDTRFKWLELLGIKKKTA